MRRFFSLLGLGLSVLSAPAWATPDDRWTDTPTGWTYLFGATSTEVTNLQNGSNQRIFNVERVGSGLYDAIGVTNVGAYQLSGMQVNYALTGTTLANLVNNNNRRIVDLETYDAGGVENHTAITVPNTGAAGAGWGYLVRASPAQIDDWITNANPPLRIIDLDVYTLNGTKQHTAVAVNNTGAQAHGWWYYYGRTAAQVTSLLTQNQARLVDIEVDTPPTLVSPATFTVVMIADNPGAGWWYPSLSSSQVAALLSQNGARLACLERYTDAFGATRYAAAMVDNADAETRRIRDLIRSTIPTGDFGFKAKQVGGPTLVSLNENFVFEPASQMKILHAAYAMHRIDIGQDDLNNTVTLNTGTNSSQSCPYSVSPTSPTLRTTIQQMMRPSSNHHTEALRQRFGTTTLNDYAGAIGLPDVRLNHTLGCLCSSLPDYNTFTARDAVSMYEQIADGSLFGLDLKDELFSIMSNYAELGNFRVDTVMNQEFALTDLTTTERAAFRDAFNQSNKGGSYTCGASSPNPRRWRTDAGWATIPFKSGGPLYISFDREYAMSIFVNDSSDPASSTDEIYNIFFELIRVPLREAMQSWDAACDPDGIFFQPQNDSVIEGDDAHFDVTLLIRPGSRDYRWQKLINGSWINLSNDTSYSGADSAMLTVLNAQSDDAGQYRVRITKVCGETVSQAATLTVSAPCPADFDNNGVLNFFDVAVFIDAYNTQDPAADLAAPFGTLNFFDVAAFINLYNAGCP